MARLDDTEELEDNNVDAKLEKIRHKMDEAKERFEEVADQTLEKGERLYKRSKKFVGKQPLRLIMGTFISGLLFGLFLKRKKD